jgi:hypothetical protein
MTDPVDTDRFAGGRERSLGRTLLALSVRIVVFGVTFGAIASLTLCAIGLVALAALLWVATRDITLSSRVLGFWPESFGTLHLYFDYAWAYLFAGFALLFGVLPMVLALLEKIVLATRRGRHPGKELIL